MSPSGSPALMRVPAVAGPPGPAVADGVPDVGVSEDDVALVGVGDEVSIGVARVPYVV
jgi:hypothetical protein